MAALSPGAKLGRYEIDSPLGAGGMGEVYLAHDSTLDRKVALKVLPESVASDRNRMQRFVQEAKAASALNHPNIITIHEIGTEPGAHFMVTEFIEGENLRHHLHKPMTLLEAIDISVQVASALATAHAAGIIHRDIKPENMMVREDGIVKVLDFGLAKLTERWRKDEVDGDAATQAFVHTEPGAVVGTTAYLSPEQARALDVDTRTDVWSLGVVLYEMITGRAPFKGETPSDTSALILTAEPPPLAEYMPDVPNEIERIVRKALQKKRDERYQTVKDMLLDLKSLRRELDVSAAMQRSGTSYSSGMTRPALSTAPPLTNQTSLVTRQFGLNRKAQIGAAGLLLVIVAGVGWYWWRHRDTEVNRIGTLTVTQLVGRKNDLGETGARHARFSPDGKFIAYASPKGSGSAIWLKQLGAGEPFSNHGETPAASSPIWSPDGLQIAFISKQESQYSIWTMAAFGGSPTLLKSLESYTRELIAWTRSGKIYFVGNDNLYVLNYATLEISPIVLASGGRDRDFAVSPDEDRIAFNDLTDGQSDIWVVPTTGGARVRITNDKARDTNPVWTSDGRRIVYSSMRNGIRQICLVGLDGSPSVQLTVNDSNTNVLDVSADGTRVLYSTDRDESDLWSFRLDRAKETQLTSESGIELWPDVAPDGNTIAYQASRASTGASVFTAQLMAKSFSVGTQDIRLAPDGFAPLWSPDGKQVAFLRNANGAANLWVVHATGGDAKQITNSGVVFGGFTQLPYNRMQNQDFQWLPDSSGLIYCAEVSGVTNIWQIGIDGSPPVQLSDNKDAGSRFFNPSWSPDGQRIAWLAYEPGHRSWGVWVLAQGQQQQIFRANLVLGLVGWSANGQELILKEIPVLDRAENTPVDVILSAISIREGKKRLIGTLRTTYFQNIKLGPARDQVAYVTRLDGPDTLQLMPVGGGPAKTIFTSSDPRVYLASIVWSSDGKTIYYGKQSSWTLFSMIDNFK